MAIMLPSVLAGPVGRQSIVKLAADSDAVIVGPVSATFTNGTVNATIQVERVLKGPLSVGSTVSVLWTLPESSAGVPFAGGTPYVSKGHGLFFLAATRDGSWALIPAAGGDIGWDVAYIATPTNAPGAVRDAASRSLPANASVLDEVYAEMVVVEEVGPPPVLDFQLVEQFRSVSQSPVLAAAFSRFAASQDPRLIAEGLRGGVLSGDPALILNARQSSATLSAEVGWYGLMNDIKTYYQNTGQPAIQNLGQVATDTTCRSELRVAAAGALARMHTQQSLPYLAVLLDDPDLVLRAMGVGGLSSFANNVPIGSHEPAAGPWKYRTDDTIAHSIFDVSIVGQSGPYYVGFWRSWWQQHRSQLAP
jgi:hypothetical protein